MTKLWLVIETEDGIPTPVVHQPQRYFLIAAGIFRKVASENMMAENTHATPLSPEAIRRIENIIASNGGTLVIGYTYTVSLLAIDYPAV